MQWQVLDTGEASAYENMALDQRLLEGLEPSKPILHLYDWKGPAATYGYFTRPETLFLPSAFKQLDLARRPTGGGVIFHLCDFAFSLLIPANHPAVSTNTLQNYQLINEWVGEMIRHFSHGDLAPTLLKNVGPEPVCSSSFCMAKATIYDIVVDGKKVGGAAQRRTRLGLLHQGSIALSMPSIDYFEEVLFEGRAVGHKMAEEGYFLLGREASLADLRAARADLKSLSFRYLRN